MCYHIVTAREMKGQGGVRLRCNMCYHIVTGRGRGREGRD